MRPTEKKIQILIQNLKNQTPPELDEKILDNCFNELNTQKSLAPVTRPNIWRIIMTSKITKPIAAAIIITAVLTGIYQLTGSIDGAGVAWADVLEQIYNTRTVMYKKTFETEKHTFTSNYMLMEPSLMRSELPHGDVMIWNFSTGVNLHLMPQLKCALVEQRIGRKQSTKIHNRFEWLKKLHEQDAEFVGEEEIDGITVNVFVYEIPFERTTVWVDTKSDLPVKVKMEYFPNTKATNGVDTIIMPKMTLSISDFGAELESITKEDGQTITSGKMSRTISISSGRGSGKGIQDKMTITYHDFNWDAELDKSLFSMIPPEDYDVKKKTFDVSGHGEDSLVYCLGFWAEMSEGTFPDVINDLGDPDKLKPMMIAKFDKDGDPEEELDAAMDEVHKILKGLYFAQEKKVEGTWDYIGQGVMLGQEDRIVCWWFDEEMECYRAILGDLSIQDITENQLPTQP